MDTVGQFPGGGTSCSLGGFSIHIVRNNILKILHFGADVQLLTCSYFDKNVLRLSERKVFTTLLSHIKEKPTS